MAVVVMVETLKWVVACFFLPGICPPLIFFLPANCPWLPPKLITNKKNPGRFARGQKKTLPIKQYSGISSPAYVLL